MRTGLFHRYTIQQAHSAAGLRLIITTNKSYLSAVICACMSLLNHLLSSAGPLKWLMERTLVASIFSAGRALGHSSSGSAGA